MSNSSMRPTKSLILFVLTCAVAVVILGAASSAFAASSETVLHNFSCCGPDDGNRPVVADLILDPAGNVYGTTASGGAYGHGVVYELMPNGGQWTEKLIYSFKSGSDGRSPHAGLIFDAAGNLYGTTGQGGAYGYGTVYELLPSGGEWTEKVLYSFGSGNDGRHPWAGVIFDAAGNLYGTTLNGGAYGYGMVYELIPSNGAWTEKVLHSFNRKAKDAISPYFGLAFDSLGNLYGATANGGNGSCVGSGCGAVFELTSGASGKWAEKLLYSFDASTAGIYPAGGVTLDKSGNLYLNISEGGTYGWGAVLELIFSSGKWTVNVLHSFAGTPSDGAYPSGGLTFDAAGNLYGTTINGGAVYAGSVFKLIPNHGSWTENLLHSFSGPPDGRFPYSSVVLDGSGNLYGTTESGGNNVLFGTVFEVTP